MTVALLLFYLVVGLSSCNLCNTNCYNFSVFDVTFAVMPRVSSGSSLHPERECGPCKLCQGDKSRYWHIGQAGPQHIQLRESATTSTTLVYRILYMGLWKIQFAYVFSKQCEVLWLINIISYPIFCWHFQFFFFISGLCFFSHGMDFPVWVIDYNCTSINIWEQYSPP